MFNTSTISKDIFKVVNEPVICQESQNPLDLLRQITYQNAQFEPGQFDTISRLIAQKKLLLIQPSGWGKSTIYQIVTMLHKSQNKGATLVISPSIPVMRNQHNLATEFGLKSAVLHYAVSYSDRNVIFNRISNHSLDLVLVTPSIFVKKDFINNVIRWLDQGYIGLLVIDEIHGISEYSHNYQDNYKEVANLVNKISVSTPLLATTSTANFHVIRDIQQQIEGMSLLKGQKGKRV